MGSEGDAPLALQVDLQKIETVIPAQPTETSPLYLSLIDQCVAYVVDTVYFYPANPEKPCADVVPKLKEALAQILVPYHFMAGRLQLNQQGKLEIDCNRAGALFCGASTDMELSELGDVTHPNPAFRNLVLQQAENVKKMSENPLLMMQVTKFRCGGFTIGFSMNHVMFDGSGALEFVMNFSSLARGQGLVVPPKPDRTMLKPRDPPQVQFEHPEYIKLADIPKAMAFTTADVAQLDFEAIKLSQKHIYKVFPFSGEMLERLKGAALAQAKREGDAELGKCSSFDAITAHVWQARTKALGLPPPFPAKVLFAVDVRSKLSPPLPKGFAGNAIVSAFACVPAGELQERSLAFAVSKVQQATSIIDDAYVRSSLDWGSVHGGVPNLPGGIFISAWWKLPFYLMDFGWGKPMYAGPVVNAMVEFVLLLSNGTDQGLNLYLALEPSRMDAFEKLVYDF